MAIAVNASRKRVSSPHPEFGSECAAGATHDGGAGPKGHVMDWRAQNAHAPMVVSLKPCESSSLPGT